MADVTEVIHKISYEVNKDALDNATKAIQLQLAELQRLSLQLDKYMSDISKVYNSGQKEVEQLSIKIDDAVRRIITTSAKSKAILEEVFSGVVKGITGNDGLKDVVSKYVSGAIKEFTKLQNASRYTGIGFAQHMKTAGAASAGVITTLSNLAKSALSFTNIFGIALTVLSLFSDELFSASNNAGDFGEEIDEASELSKKLGEESASEIGKLITLKSKIEDTTVSYDDRSKAIAELRGQYPGYFDHLTNEELLAGKVADAYNRVLKGIIAAARARVLTRKLDDEIAQVEELTEKIQQLAAAGNVNLTPYIDKSTGLNLFDLNEDDKKTATRDLLYGNASKNYSDNTSSRQIVPADTHADDMNRTAALSQISYYIQSLKQNVSDLGELSATIARLQSESEVQKPSVTPQNTYRNDKQERKKEEPLEMIDNYARREIPQPELSFVDVPEVKIPDSTEEDDKRRDKIRNQIKDYAELAQAAADAYNKILQVQIDTLDKEISLREKRVEEAKKLAERGNTEALRLEEERLRKAQQQRENFARRQQAVNAAITVSNAIAAVARAALEGGGFGSVATIAALIAALAAGYAAVTSLSNDSGDAFADGVIDYRGMGGPKDDKNWVRISTGESIITAEGTKKHRALLEAINTGARLQLSDVALPFMMPAFKQPALDPNGKYASANDMQRLETKLDEVVGAIEDNKLKQDIFFNEQGVGIMTERAIQRDHRRWK